GTTRELHHGWVNRVIFASPQLDALGLARGQVEQVARAGVEVDRRRTELRTRQLSVTVNVPREPLIDLTNEWRRACLVEQILSLCSIRRDLFVERSSFWRK